MSIIIIESIFKYLNSIDTLYCCILYPSLINLKIIKSIYLSSKHIHNFELILKIIKYFYNFIFELLLFSPEDLNYNYRKLKNLYLTLDFYNYNLIFKKDTDTNFYHTLDLPFDNIRGINSFEFHIQGYYKLKNNYLTFNNIKSVIITTENTIQKINLIQVEKFVLNDGFELESINFDHHLKCLSIFKPNSNILNLINCNNNIEELLINEISFNKNIAFKKLFPKLKHIQLDSANFYNIFDIDNLFGDYKSLSANYCQIKFEDFTNYKSLKNLQLSNNNIIEKIIGFSGRNLFLDNCMNLNVFTFQNLDSLYLKSNPNIRGKHTEHLKNIKILDLSGTKIEYLSDKITNLEIFIGHSCINLQYFPKYQNLDTLNLNNCTKIRQILTLKVNILNVNKCGNLENLDQISFNQIFT